MRVRYSLHPDEYATGIEAVTDSIASTKPHELWNKRVKLVSNGYVAFFLIVVIAAVLYYPEIRIQLLVFAAIIVAAQETARWSINRASKSSYGSTYNQRRHMNVEAVFGEDTVEHIGQEHKQVWNWTLLQRLHDLPTLHVLEFAGFDMLVIPKRLWESPEEERSWLDNVRKHIAANGRG